MKILYAAGELNDSNIRLSHFLHEVSSEHEIKVCCYSKNSEYLNTVHWNLDALKYGKLDREKSLEYIGEPLSLNPKALEMFLDDVSKYNPEVFIIDYEPISALIANTLDIPFISCSPVHLINGIKWKTRNKNTAKIPKDLKYFDSAIEKLIYAPFGVLENAPELNDGFDWITPYQYDSYREGLENIVNKIHNSNKFVCTGTSGSVSKGILERKQICVLNEPDNLECTVNGIFVDSLGLGVCLGKAEENMEYAALKVDEFINKTYSYTINKNYEYLHERII